MPPAGLEEGPAPLWLRVDEVAGEENGVEAPTELEPLDLRLDRLRVVDVREHLLRLVDCGHAIAEPHELPRDPPGAATQLEQRGSGGNHRRDDLAFPQLRQPRVELDRAAVRRRVHPAGA